MTRIKRWWAWFQTTSPWHAWQRYLDRRGNLLAGGVAFNAFFSIFPVVALAFTVFGFLLQDHPQWLDAIRETVNEQLPGFVQDPETGEGIIPISVPQSSTLVSIAGVGLLVMLWAGLGWLSALRNAIRQIFGVPGSPGNFALAKLRDLGVLIVLGVGIVVSAAITTVANTLAERASDLLGLGGETSFVSTVGILAGFVLDGALVALMLRILSGVDVPWRGVRNGALFGGMALTVLKIFGTRLLAGTLNNPLFASFALVVGLLVWLNLMSRIVLISAAWAANDLDVAAARRATAGEEEPAHGAAAAPLRQGAGVDVAPAGVAVSRRAGSGAPPRQTAYGDHGGAGRGTLDRRAADRVSVAAGAVLGAAGVLGLRAARRAFGSVRPRR
jgi:membrane protein